MAPKEQSTTAATSTPPPGLARRVLASQPLRVLVLGFVMLVVLGLSSDVMHSYAAERVRAAVHIIAPAIAGLAVCIAHAQFVEPRAASELRPRGMGR